METRFLLLWLEAPLQSWGASARVGLRETLDFPTKSGILGLVLCAMGAGGAQTELLARFAELRQTVVGYRRDANPGRLRDFHMVGGGYDESDPWQVQMMPHKVDGKKPVGIGGKLTTRHFLQGAYFAVALEAPADLAQAIRDAFDSPVWELYLGRKCCVPTDFIFRGIFEDEEKALSGGADIAAEKSLSRTFTVRDRLAGGAGRVLALNDVPVSFGDSRVYRDRQVVVL